MTKNLQEKIESMLAGEKKRRDIALQWLDELKDIIIPASYDIWSNSIYIEETDAVWIRFLDDEGKRRQSSYYFRFGEHFGKSDTEFRGFYVSPDGVLFWGRPLVQIYGVDFWHAISTVYAWVKDILIPGIDEKSAAREKMVSLLNISEKE